MKIKLINLTKPLQIGSNTTEKIEYNKNIGRNKSKLVILYVL